MSDVLAWVFDGFGLVCFVFGFGGLFVVVLICLICFDCLLL